LQTLTIPDKVLDVLKRLGLTELQAKTYLTLTHLEKAEVKKISKFSDIARQDIYRIMPTLEKLGLVEKIISTPVLYRAIPLNEGTLRLFQKRTEEHARLKSSLKSVINNREENSNAAFLDSNVEFVITSERKRFVRSLEKSFSTASKCDMICPGEALSFMVFNFYDCLVSAASRGVKIRFITQKTDVNLSITRQIQSLTSNPNFEMKFVDSAIDTGIIIVNNEVNIRISDSKAVPSLWTNNRQILKIAQTKFENQWNNIAAT
jgi:sugar-specific transcriptional regulator TrmB